MFGVVEVLLVPEEDDLVADDRRFDCLDGGGIEVAGKLDSMDTAPIRPPIGRTSSGEVGSLAFG
ncbi:MAG: hypothetical protein RL268_311 [Pseudomonadota bacterium]